MLWQVLVALEETDELCKQSKELIVEDLDDKVLLYRES
jgi:hypothetical protein